MLMKNSSDTIGNQTRDIPACSVVPQILFLFGVLEIMDKASYDVILTVEKQVFLDMTLCRLFTDVSERTATSVFLV
jgi:hypothetical protein